MIKHATTTQVTMSGEDLDYSSAMAHRYIQANTDMWNRDSYHFICWDSKLPTPGVQEWLHSIEPGDTIVVYPRAADEYMNQVFKMEIDIYWEN